jgi:hypothetical protein
MDSETLKDELEGRLKGDGPTFEAILLHLIERIELLEDEVEQLSNELRE